MGYVWCDGYVWDMCGVRYVWDMCGVRYANNLLKNPATKRLSGKNKTKKTSPPNYARWSCKGTGLTSSLTLGSQETAPFLVPQNHPPHIMKKNMQLDGLMS